jgi:hypothetical protein
MKLNWRATLVVTGSVMLYVVFLLPLWKPLGQTTLALPPLDVLHPAFYLWMLHGMVHVLGATQRTVLILDMVLVLGTALFVFYLGWRLTPNERPTLLGGVLAVVFFLLNPAVSSQSLFRISGEFPSLALGLLGFLSCCLAVEHWSIFMRSIVLSILWAVLLWVHWAGAFWVLLCMLPWVIFNRRPLSALALWLTVCILGSLLFGASWLLYSVLVSGRAGFWEPWIRALAFLPSSVQEGARALAGSGHLIVRRGLAVVWWLSPFGVVSSGWAMVSRLAHMVRQRRANTAAYIALVAIGAGFICVFVGPPEGGWSIRYPMALAALCSPLMAQVLASRDGFMTRSVRLPVLMSFLVCGVFQWVWMKWSRLSGPALAADFISLLVLSAAAGWLSSKILISRRLGNLPRVQAVLTGSTLGYFLVLDLLLMGR